MQLRAGQNWSPVQNRTIKLVLEEKDNGEDETVTIYATRKNTKNTIHDMETSWRVRDSSFI